MPATATLPYSIRATSNRLVEVVNPAGRVYRVALSEQGHVLLCTCPASAHGRTCKHLGMVADRLRGDGLPLPGGGRLIIRPGLGMVEDGRRDPFARFEPCRRTISRVWRGAPDAEVEYDPMDDIERQERRDAQHVAALDEDGALRAADYRGEGR